jgi:hypothetical protein
MRNLTLTTDQVENTASGIYMLGQYIPVPEGSPQPIGASSDLHFSGLTIEKFKTGFYAGPVNTKAPPMIDGVSMKNMTFSRNEKAVDLNSSNISNWNIQDLNMESNNGNAIGWNQVYGGHQGFQKVRCTGLRREMVDCLNMRMVAGAFINDFRKTDRVANGLTINEGASPYNTPYFAFQPSNFTIRNSDFTTSNINILGKAFITSMNNQYSTFSAEAEGGGTISRVTWCDDKYPEDDPYPALAKHAMSRWVGIETSTIVKCGERPIPWDDAVRVGGKINDKPLTGNFYDDVRDDFVVFSPDAPSKFIIRQAGETGEERSYTWGLSTDTPLVGSFISGQHSQIAIWRPTTTPTPTGEWWIKEPNNCTDPDDELTCHTRVWNFGLPGDTAFVGNFFDEPGPTNLDEIAIWRPSTTTFWFMNPETTDVWVWQISADHGTEIYTGDFMGRNRDQIAQYDRDSGTWYIVDPVKGDEIAPVLGGKPFDVPVPGKYLPAASIFSPQCTQIGFWRSDDQKFYIADASNDCGGRNAELEWGSNDDFGDQTPVPDIPVAISTEDGLFSRPAVYRPTKGAFEASIANGQWWVHDRF